MLEKNLIVNVYQNVRSIFKFECNKKTIQNLAGNPAVMPRMCPTERRSARKSVQRFPPQRTDSALTEENKTCQDTKSKGNIQTHAAKGREILMRGFLKSLIKGKG